MSVPNSTILPRSNPISGNADDMLDFDGAAEILRAWNEGLTPDPDLTVSEWADRHRMLSGRASAEPGRYPQQSPWLSIANKQLEIMGRFMAELGLTPSARARLPAPQTAAANLPTTIKFVSVYEHRDGSLSEEPPQSVAPERKN